MLRNAFRGKPVGSLRPRSSGIKADENKVRFAPNVECGEGFLRPAECAGKKTNGGPYDVRFSADWPLAEGGAWGDVQKTEFSAAKD